MKKLLFLLLLLLSCGPAEHGRGYGDSFNILVTNASGSPVKAIVRINQGSIKGRHWWEFDLVRDGETITVHGLLVPAVVEVAATNGRLYWFISKRAKVDYPADTDGRVLIYLQ